MPLLYDIGANVGLWSLANKENNTIIAVEASPNVFTQLQQNVKDYDITPINCAICAGDTETIEFYNAKESPISTLNKSWLTDEKSRFYNSTFETITVPRMGLDELITKYGQPELIKIDVEGAENAVLQSLTQKVSMIAFEWAAEMRDVSIECIEYLHQLGYNQFDVQLNNDEYRYRPNGFSYNKETLIDFIKSTKDKHDWGMIWAS